MSALDSFSFFFDFARQGHDFIQRFFPSKKLDNNDKQKRQPNNRHTF